jgi:hypothetical protein
MRRAFLAFLLAAVVSTAVYAEPIKRPREFRSMPSLVAMVDGKARPICTLVSINEPLKLWMTAAHCLMVPKPWLIEGEIAQAVMVDPDRDLAILRTQIVRAPAVPLATNPPRFEEEVKLYQYPFGVPIIGVGRVANPDVVFPFGPQPQLRRMLIAVVGEKGASGGPVLNKRGELVSIVQIVAFSSVMGGATLSSLERYRRYFEGEADGVSVGQLFAFPPDSLDSLRR